MIVLGNYLKKLTTEDVYDFLSYLEDVKGYSELSIKTYQEAILEALKYMEITSKDDVTQLNLMPYRLKISHLKTKTISKKLSAIRSFVKQLRKKLPEGLLKVRSKIGYVLEGS